MCENNQNSEEEEGSPDSDVTTPNDERKAAIATPTELSSDERKAAIATPTGLSAGLSGSAATSK